MPVPAFSYSISPSSLLVSQTQQLVLTITNSGAAPVSCGLDLTITLTLPVGTGASDLVTAEGAPNVTAAPQDPNWSQNVDSDAQSVTIQVFPARSTSLPAGGQLTVVVAGVAVNSVVSSPGATLTVQATSRSESGPLQSFTVAKIAAGMTLSAYASPVAVGQGGSTTIYWSATGASHVQLSLNGSVIHDVAFQGPGPVWSGKFTQVRPFPNTPQTTYVVTVLDTSGANQLATQVLIGLDSPSIVTFKADKQNNLLVSDSVSLSWDTQYGAAAYLTASTGGGSQAVELQEDDHPVVPGSFLSGTPNSDSLDLTLSVTGYLGPATKPLTFRFAPAAISYFSYVSMTPSDGVAAAVVFNGKGTATGNADNSWTLRVVGPGGPLLRTIGGATPSVNYFGPADAVLSAPGEVTFSYWVVGMKSGDTLMLNGKNVSVDATGKGSTVVSVSATSSYTLHAVLSGQTIDNTVQVTVSAASKEKP